MQKLNWGIIGCGDVTELKSGPAFSKIENSTLVAVMRRDAEKAKDYAARHHVSKWYTNAGELINDPDVNAIYIATPPSSHEAYSIAAINAGKPVYVEKPVAMNAAAALRLQTLAEAKGIKLVVAHYRRALPYFEKIKSLIEENTIGEVRFAKLQLSTAPVSRDVLLDSNKAWRFNPAISGGGLFHDLSPHQLDIMYHLFGAVAAVQGFSLNQQQLTAADDLVSGSILFESGVLFNGLWCFNAAAGEEQDICEIVGSEGKISFGFFGKSDLLLHRNGTEESFSFEPPLHIQQPMIEKVVAHFLGEGENPCQPEDAVVIMDIIDQITGK